MSVFRSAYLANGMKSSQAAVSVVYRRENGEAANLSVWDGRTEAEQTNDKGLAFVVRGLVRLTATADFEDAFGVGERPANGDVIEDSGRRLRVRPQNGEPEYREVAGGTILRMNVKDEGTVD